MRVFFITIIFSIILNVQEVSNDSNKYKEDQIYFGTSYLLINHDVYGFKQNGFSKSIQFGFIKDMPMNSDGNKAIGLGIGYSFNHQISNLNIFKNKLGNEEYEIINDSSVDSKISMYSQLIEFPLEYRWRTSNYESYSFWRIYGGYKFSYRFSNIARPNYNEKFVIKNVIPFSHALTLTMGYNTWNLYFEYGLTKVFKNYDKSRSVIPFELKPIKIGLMFYFL